MFHSVYQAGVSLMLPMKRRPCATLHSPCPHVNTDIHVLRVIYRKAVWSAVSWRMEMGCFSTASGPPNLLLYSALPSHWAKSQRRIEGCKFFRLWKCARDPRCVENSRPVYLNSHTQSICCGSAPSIHRTDRENTRVHVLDEIKPWFQYMIIILTHVRVRIIDKLDPLLIKRPQQAISIVDFNMQALISNAYSWSVGRKKQKHVHFLPFLL